MNYLSEVGTVFRQAIRLQSTRLVVANYSKTTEPKADEVYDEDENNTSITDLLVDEVDAAAREQQIMRMQDKSRLRKTQRNFLFNLPKPDEEFPWDKTLYFSRKQYARYGSQTNINPRICFYTPAEVADKQEFERVAYPLTIQQMVEVVKKEKADKLEAIRQREEKIAQNLMKLEKWKQDLHLRIAKKEEEAQAARTKREQMLEDIRQEIGFKIDFKDPRFQALMEKKELEAKKAKKAAKKKQREDQLLEKLKEQAKETLDKSEGDEDKSKKEKSKADSDSSDSDSDDEKEEKKK